MCGGGGGPPQLQAVEGVLYCPSQLVSEKQTRVRTRRAEVALLAGLTKGLFSYRLHRFPPPEGDLSFVSGCWWWGWWSKHTLF